MILSPNHLKHAMDTSKEVHHRPEIKSLSTSSYQNMKSTPKSIEVFESLYLTS